MAVKFVPLYRKVPAGVGVRYRSNLAEETAQEINNLLNIDGEPVDDAWITEEGQLVIAGKFGSDSNLLIPRTGDWIIIDTESDDPVTILPVEQFTHDFLPPQGRAF